MTIQRSNNYICTGCGQTSSDQFHSKHCKIPINFECFQCSKSFKNWKLLKQHYKTHSQMSQYECKVCSKKLKSKQNLDNHIKFVHSECPRDKVCSVCNSKFRTTKHLKRHETIHMEMLYHCELCNKSFHFKYNQAQHVKNCYKKF